MPRLLVDSGVYVSAAITGSGPPVQLLELAVEGRAVLLVSPRLLAELRQVLIREKFRRWITIDEVAAFLDALMLLAEMVEDPPEGDWARVCRDPDDDYLIALAQASAATLLISGDRDLLELRWAAVDVRSPRSAVDALLYRHGWGPAVIPGDEDVAWRQARAEGHDQVLQAASAFLVMLRESDAAELLPFIVTPESLDMWLQELTVARAMTGERGMTSRPEYPAPDVAYVKLPPDPGRVLKATGQVLLDDAIVLTLQRRPELPDALALGGWRVHSLGRSARPKDLP